MVLLGDQVEYLWHTISVLPTVESTQNTPRLEKRFKLNGFILVDNRMFYTNRRDELCQASRQNTEEGFAFHAEQWDGAILCIFLLRNPYFPSLPDPSQDLPQVAADIWGWSCSFHRLLNLLQAGFSEVEIDLFGLDEGLLGTKCLISRCVFEELVDVLLRAWELGTALIP